MSEVLYRSRVSLTREQPPLRRARLLASGEEVVFGVPGEIGEHYGFAPGQVELHAGTLDYIVAATAGCLIGTLGGALAARKIPSRGDHLTAEAEGEVEVEDGVLVLRRIHLRYRLRAAPEHREAAERAHAKHAPFCPTARSLGSAIAITTELAFEELPAAARATAAGASGA